MTNALSSTYVFAGSGSVREPGRDPDWSRDSRKTWTCFSTRPAPPEPSAAEVPMAAYADAPGAMETTDCGLLSSKDWVTACWSASKRRAGK